jgi:hypothetical protein
MPAAAAPVLALLAIALLLLSVLRLELDFRRGLNGHSGR